MRVRTAKGEPATRGASLQPAQPLSLDSAPSAPSAGEPPETSPAEVEAPGKNNRTLLSKGSPKSVDFPRKGRIMRQSNVKLKHKAKATTLFVRRFYIKFEW